MSNTPPASVSLDALVNGLNMDSPHRGRMGIIDPGFPYWTGINYIKTTTGRETFTQSGYPYDTADTLWILNENVNGSLSHLSSSRGAKLSIGTGVGDKIVRSTKQLFVYSAGNYTESTFACKSELEPGRFSSYGVFDGENGFYVKVVRGGVDTYNISLVRRSKASGTIVEEVIPQSQWNMDTLDGNGESGLTLDPTTIQMVYIGYTWYGGGSCRIGFTIEDVTHIAHIFTAGNRLNEPLLGNPSLPIRFELGTTEGATPSTAPSSLCLWGSHVSVVGSGNTSKSGYPRSIERYSISVQSGNTYHLFTLRPKVSFKEHPNRSWVRVRDFSVFGTAAGVFRLLYNAVPTGGGNFTNLYPADGSFMEADITSTSFSNTGLRIYSGGLSSNRGGSTVSVTDFKDPLTPFSDFSGSNSVSLAFTCSTNGTIGGTLNYEEVY